MRPPALEPIVATQYNMTETTYGPLPWNPLMATGITTTGSDYENMMRSVLAYEGLDKKTCDEMETDLTKNPIRPSGDGWFGHYAMGHVSRRTSPHVYLCSYGILA